MTFHPLSSRYAQGVLYGIFRRKARFPSAKGLTFASVRAYNTPIHGMRENTFPFLRPSESMRLVRACRPRRKYRLLTVDGPRPIQRSIKGSGFRERKRGIHAGRKRSADRESRQQGWNRGRRTKLSRSSLHSHDGAGVFICPPTRGKPPAGLRRGIPEQKEDEKK